jgi:hypothetical protein
VNCSKNESLFGYITKFFAIIGLYTALLILLGYLYASTPLTKERTCTPDFIDRVLK